jgi:hypothetical protein
MSSALELVEKHIRIWQETDRDKRRGLIPEVYSTDCKIVDPFYPDEFVGHDALMTLIDEVHAKFAGFRFTVIPGSMQEHHGLVRFSWYYGPEDNPKAISGQDFLMLKHNLVHFVTLFIDEPSK